LRAIGRLLGIDVKRVTTNGCRHWRRVTAVVRKLLRRATEGRAG
jgi:hypothetical protein